MLIKTSRGYIDVLDTYLFHDSLRIQVFALSNVQKIEEQYIIRKPSIRKVYEYYKEIGLKYTLLKILSRKREKIRNEKYFSIGIGRILASRAMDFQANQSVYFIAYNHPACSERIVIHKAWAKLAENQNVTFLSNSIILNISYVCDKKRWDALIGWSPFSGVNPPDLRDAFEHIKQYWENCELNPRNSVRFKRNTIVRETSELVQKAYSRSKNSVLFGYGNYAKTILLPNIHKDIHLASIHEIDPTQLFPNKKHIHYDTSPIPRDDRQYDVYFIAGYHHTHSEIAIRGLSMDADVVAEKPLMTNREDMKKLLTAMKTSKGELYACFQRRYLKFNQFVYKDFNLKPGDPISYYAIVYEEVLPKNHWYRWPNSCSAIVSNGCHWIDHFLFLNNYSPIHLYQVHHGRQSEIIVLVTLENGATLSLTLSHLGAARIGMQDYIELRTQSYMAKIINSKYYQSENNSRIIRKNSINKFNAYHKMYQLISHNIVNKDAPRLSDSVEKVVMVSNLILSLDDQVRCKMASL